MPTDTSERYELMERVTAQLFSACSQAFREWKPDQSDELWHKLRAAIAAYRSATEKGVGK